MEEDGGNRGGIVSDRSRPNGERREELREEARARGEAPLYSHIRELAPSKDVSRENDSPDEARNDSNGSGFFAQAARISMGTAFPALRSVARFLSLESYRSLPKHDRLPDLGEDFIETELDDILEQPEDELQQPEDEPPAPGEQLLDWDELSVEELARTPYRLYLFDVRIQGYLRETKAQLSSLLLAER